MQFDISNPDHRAQGLATAVGYRCNKGPELTEEQRIALGKAVQEQFPDMDYVSLIHYLTGTVKEMHWVPGLSEKELAAIRARAELKICLNRKPGN